MTPDDDSVPDVSPIDGVAETSVGLTSGLAMGTPSYMSPEQARGQRANLDERSDVFALGALLYHALAGRPPHTGPTHDDVLAAARLGRVTPPSIARGHAVPLELQRIAMQAMHADREQRYRAVSHFRDDLQRYLYVARDFPTATYAAGEHIIREGEPGHAVYIIERGRCRAYRRDASAELVLSHMGPGDIFGETAVLAEIPRTASVVAEEPTTVHVVTREVLETELGDIKPWLAKLIRALASRFRNDRTRNLLLQIETGG